MILLRIGPGGKLRDDVELAEQIAHHLMRIVSHAEVVELIEHLGDRVVGVGNGALGVVLALLRETFTMLKEFLTIEVGQ